MNMSSLKPIPPRNCIAVLFISVRSKADPEGYAQAARAMESLVEAQPGYLGLDAARQEDGSGITISYWADEASALAWRAQAEHSAIRQIGRERWYTRYRLIVTQVVRACDWERPA